MSSRERIVAGFTGSYLLGALGATLATDNREFLFYIGVVVLLIGAVLVVHRRVGLTVGALWCLSLWGLAHMAGGLVPLPAGWPYNGDVPVLYSGWLVVGKLKYDHLVHAFGFGVTTWVCWQALGAAVPTARPTLGLLVLCAAAGLGFGALNEIVEFAATLLVPETNVGGYWNTGWDLVANLVGVCAAAGLIAARARPVGARA